ncbi:hypothetical protein ABT330_25495 [Streptomyces sp. NPDC000658]|uniref:hypothetical protein n=1 Tax=Streptomyces sp. NPDC000658 TaxID=3154266 RepID=UPI003334A472
MTIGVSDLPEALVRKRMNEMLETCQWTNTKPSVLKLACQLGLSNTTFRRRFPDIARELGTLRAAPAMPADGPSEHDRLIDRNAKLRRRNQELASELALDLALGETIDRAELHDRYGGRIHPRISPSRTTQNVFLFTTPAGIFDSWTGEHVHFTGEGAAKERIRYPPTATSPSCTIAPKTAPCGCSVARFAQVEAVLVLATQAQHFHLDVDPHPTRLLSGPFLQPATPMRATVRAV